MGFWGKAPFLDNASFGLSALQTLDWRTRKGETTQLFYTEHRVGLFHHSKGNAYSFLGYHRRSGSEFNSTDSRTTGVQGTYAPRGSPVAYFLSLDHTDYHSKETEDDTRFYAGIDVLQKKWTNVGGLAGTLLKGDSNKKTMGRLMKLAWHAIEFLKNRDKKLSETQTAHKLMESLRRKALEGVPPLALWMANGSPLVRLM